MTMAAQTPGEIACREWTASHLAHHSCRITGWEDIRDEDKADWEAAAAAAFEAGREAATDYLAKGGSFK
jgi:hypothetical protein